MIIAGVAGAFPENLYSQEAIAAAFKSYWGERLTRPETLDRFHSRTGVRQRHLAFPMERYPEFKGWGETNKAWLEVAGQLGERAIDSALDKAGLARDDIDALIAISVTGVASPSLDARIINRMGLRSDIKRTPIFGVGCVGGAIGLTRAADYVRAYPKHRCALLCVELCSLTIQKDDLSVQNLISTGLFADGAAAVIVSGVECDAKGPRILATRSNFYPTTEDIMGWDITEKGFGIVLSAALPDLIRTRLGPEVDSFLASHGVKREQIKTWVIHPGGPKIIEAAEAALSLNRSELALSWESLAKCGNLSSASVLLVLGDTMEKRSPAPGSLGLLVAVGPGFSSEMLLLQW